MLFGVGLPVSVFLFEIFLPLIFKYFSLAVFRDRVGFRQILHKRFQRRGTDLLLEEIRFERASDQGGHCKIARRTCHVDGSIGESLQTDELHHRRYFRDAKRRDIAQTRRLNFVAADGCAVFWHDDDHYFAS